MNREVSSYLDCARLLASCLVLLGHMELNWTPGIGHFLVPLGNESVAILFVISGFVIGYVSTSRETTLKSYLIHRAARIYSILIPCVAFGLLLDFVGKHYLPHYYDALSWPPLHSDVHLVLAGLFSLTFVGAAWGANAYPGSMAPYWTLPYEVTYYLVFAFAWYLRGWRRLLLLLVVCAVAGPPLFTFFPLWLTGMIAYRFHRGLTLSITAGRLIFCIAVFVALVAQTIIWRKGLTFGYGAQESPELWPFYLTGALFAVMMVAFGYSGIVISRYTAWARWFAGASGTLYLLHFPLARLLNGLVPWQLPTYERLALIALPVIGITLLFAQLGERRKEAWHRKIEAGCDWVEAFFQQRKLVTQKDS